MHVRMVAREASGDKHRMVSFRHTVEALALWA